MKRDKPAQIMKTAERLFTSRRFHEITMAEIAEKAGVGKGTIYRYFKNKEDLFLEVALAGFDSLCDVVRTSASEQDNFEAQLLKVCIKITRFFRDRRQLFHMMQSEERRMLWRKGKMRELLMERRRRLVTGVAGVLQHGKEQGMIRSDIPLEVLAALLLSMLRTRAHEMKSYPEILRRHEVIVDFFCHGAYGPGTLVSV